MNISSHALPHIVKPFFFNILRSFRACMHVCVNTIQYNTIQYNITLLSRKREICVQRSSKCVQRSSKVFVHAYESGRNKTHACLLCIQNMNLLKVNVSGKSNPPSVKAGYGPGQQSC